MKQNKYLAVTLLLAFIFSALISLPITYAETADVPTRDEYVAEIEETTTATNQSQIQVTNADDCVTYTAQQKTLQITRGSFDDNSLIVTNGVKTFAIASYDWYIVEYMQSFVLVADVTSYLTVDQQAIPVAIFLYPADVQDLVDQTFDIDTDTTSTIRLLYTNINQTECHKIIAPVSETAYQQIYTLATEWDLSRVNDDYVSKSLIESFSYEDNFTLSMSAPSQMQNITDEQITMMSTNTVEYANYLNTVPCNAYDSYTDTDSYIKSYLDVYQGKSQSYYSGVSDTPYTDDPITRIIPKQLFTTSDKTYSYLGKEYGFFIKSGSISNSYYISSYLVFDIDVVEPYPGRTNNSPAPSVTVRPLFSGTVKYINGGIVAQEYSDPKLALANVDVAVSVSNASRNNIGDTGYVAAQDYGYAIGSYSFTANGTGPTKDTDEVTVNCLGLTLGFLETVSAIATATPNPYSIAVTALGAMDFISDCITEIYRFSKPTLVKSGNSFSVTGTMIGNTNTNTMISNYGNLVKGFNCGVLNSSGQEETDSALLYKNSNHYFKVEYGFCQKSADVNWDALVTTQISVDIYQDDTTKLMGLIPMGEIDLLDSVTGGRIDTYNESPSSILGGTIQEEKLYRTAFTKDVNAGEDSYDDETYIPASGSYRDFYFTPNRTHLYSIDTFNLSPGADSYLKLYDSQNNLISSNDDGGGSLKAKITTTLTGGQTYKIRTMCYNYNAGAYDFIVRKHGVLTQPSRTSITATSITIQSDSVWLQFIPTYDDFYSFTTTGSMDTVITLYDSDYNKYAVDDDSGSGANGLIDIYLKGGKTYYLKVNRYSTGSGQCNVYVSRQRLFLFGYEGAELCEYTLYFDSAQFYRLEPTTTQAYAFKTSIDVDCDPYMDLYDASWNLLASNDDCDGDDLNSEITYTLQAGSIYYIRVRNLLNSMGSGHLYEN